MKKRLLFTVTRPILGGAQKWIAKQIELFYNEFDIYLVCASEGWIVDEVRPYVKALLVDENLNKKFSVSHLLTLKSFIEEHHIDLVIASSANAGVHARLSKLLTKVDVVYVSHGWSAVYNGTALTRPIFVTVEKFLAFLTTTILNISKSDFEIARDTIGIDPKKMLLITNAIEPLGKRLEVDTSTKIKIAMVARFEPPKRQELLIEALENFQDMELYLIGDGPLLDACRLKYKSSNIHFVGASDNVYSELKECNIFALISDHEGLPLSVIEAMSIGMPLLLSDIDGCRPLVLENGLLVENSVASIEKALEQLAKSNLKVWGTHSYEQYNKEFNLEKSKENYRRLYASS